MATIEPVCNYRHSFKDGVSCGSIKKWEERERGKELNWRRDESEKGDERKPVRTYLFAFIYCSIST